jgi:hypothetical protein
VNVDPELRKRVERIKSSPVQMYREAGDYSNRELVEGILVSPEDIAAIEAVARAESVRLACPTCGHDPSGHTRGGMCDGNGTACHCVRMAPIEDAIVLSAHHRMVQRDHYQRWER